MAIKSKLPELRAKHGRLSLRELSVRTGITAANLSKLDRSLTTRVDLGTLDKLCDFFKVSPGDLLEHVPNEVDAESQAWLGADLSRMGELAPDEGAEAEEGEPVTWDPARGEFVVGV